MDGRLDYRAVSYSSSYIIPGSFQAFSEASLLLLFRGFLVAVMVI